MTQLDTGFMLPDNHEIAIFVTTAAGLGILETCRNVLWYGTIDNASTAKGDTLTVSGTWVLDSDANVDKLVINSGGKVVKNGHTLNYDTLPNDGTIDVTTTGLTYTQTRK